MSSTFEEEMKLSPIKSPKLMVEDTEKIVLEGLEKTIQGREQTFVLCFPSAVVYKDVGEILMEFEKISLKLIRIRLVCATEKFFIQFFAMEGRNILPNVTPAEFCRYPFVAMVVEGEDAISKVHQLTSTAERYPFLIPAVRAYSSVTPDSVKEDCRLWFGIDSANWIEEAKESNLLAVALPGGQTFGPVDTVLTKLSQRCLLKYEYFKEQILANSSDLYSSFYSNFYNEDLTFVLIRPMAFEKGCVGHLLSIIENTCFCFRGMDLVKKPENPIGDAWPADSCSSHEKDEYGIALLIENFYYNDVQLNTSCSDAGMLIDTSKEKVGIFSDLIYVGKPGDTCMIGDYFKCGTVSWVDSSTGAVCGGCFLATLSSLQF
ncbi:uncharacterized protein LOC113340775 isoform X1 [Papaver somniferum]|uniref:uncharacterized protein LOC113340775 isoform X1 n=1 Tax=Papaver somniferum TaxID=3469 RepID=UPI000E70247F|nr:uncharacterized protein LOC113340775 isoform X1 [Papaver somniferum]XP_026441640.1 uncharacterized protein LOC113340775 isoform X1 [Papaver somniferum]XP_026441641.1 uncharacterized protein LOC113340775 isoform X1 [Papaver somniferum]